jgi:outer membrane biosynthesis protein TonB
MDGRLSDGGQVYTLDALKQHRARQVGDGWLLPLSDQSRGKVSIGDLTLLFQFVTEPPKQPRPMLPASVRGTFADRIDPRLAVTESASIVACFLIYIWAVIFNDPYHKPTDAEVAFQRTFPPQVQEATFDVPQTAPDTKGTDQVKPVDKPKDVPQQKPQPKNNGGDKSPKPPDKGGRDEKSTVALQEEATREADALFTDDDAKQGLSGGMNRRKPVTDLGTEMDEVKNSGANVEIGGGTGRTARGDGSARTGTGKGPHVDTGGVQGQDKGEEKVPVGRITPTTDKQSLDETSLTIDSVLAKIMGAYMAGLKRCQSEMLKTDPTSGGKVTLAFTVGESGRVNQASVSGLNPTIDACIQARVMGWRFAEPKDSDGKKTTAQFQISLMLVAH